MKKIFFTPGIDFDKIAKIHLSIIIEIKGGDLQNDEERESKNKNH